MSRNPIRLVGLLLFVLLIGACGDDAEKPTPTAAPAGSSAGSNSGGGAGATATAAATARSTTTAPGALPIGAAFCADWGRAAAQAQRVGGPPTGNPSDLRTGLETAGSVMHALAAQAPAELRADFQVFAKGFGDFNAAMAKANYDFTKMATDPELRKAAEAMSEPRMEQASKNIQTWMEKNCTVGR